MFLLKAFKEFFRLYIYSSPSCDAESEEQDQKAEFGVSHATTKAWNQAATELRNIATQMRLSIACNPWMKSDDRPSDAYFPQMYRQFQHDLYNSRGSWEDYPWRAFDMFKWTEVYRATRSLGLLPQDHDHGSLPKNWTLCMGMTLYIALLVTKQSLDCAMKEIQTRLEGFPHLAKTPLRLQTHEMRQLKEAERIAVRGAETFNRMLENMALELSVALGKIETKAGDDEAGEEGSREPIREILRREIHKVHPHLELPELTMLVDL
ncbi:uncharacterized protein Z520_03695 [Fonsecaea multimorphosa CBS 102226]|uniref:Uncharacterized protein n=1 Tax=Fonsecaea multimorphosa CBS 102226 TaxID=1442371 RepID=A0A0D2KW82_9EURO|nr:uncharacterized protein Z520_03695 [Fonsecaea multimorphosa CBS 102226]KIY01029.1 hypothetical protein Z520_03695 [Fonsecaea multimorphosa CBS 102226]OAL27612.1 hypothetical protein AYO22_03516 [Fonsecaea multimorphosa]